MSETTEYHTPTARRKRPPLPPGGLSDAEVEQLLRHFLRDKHAVEEPDLLGLVTWGHLMRQGAYLLEQALAGTVRLVVKDGQVVEAWPIGQEAGR